MCRCEIIQESFGGCFRQNNNANNVSQSGQLDWEINDAGVRDMHDRLQ